MELAGEMRAEAAELAQRFDAAGLTHLIAICDAAGRSCKVAASPRAILDAALVRLSLSEKLADVNALLAGQLKPVAGRNGSAMAGSAGGKK